MEGRYELATASVNGHNYWVKKDGKGSPEYAAFWKDKWHIALYSDLGESKAFVHGPFGDQSWPNDIRSSEWKYVDQYGDWQQGGNNDVIVNTGKYLPSSTKTSLKWLSDHKRSLACDFSLV